MHRNTADSAVLCCTGIRWHWVEAPPEPPTSLGVSEHTSRKRGIPAAPAQWMHSGRLSCGQWAKVGDSAQTFGVSGLCCPVVVLFCSMTRHPSVVPCTSFSTSRPRSFFFSCASSSLTLASFHCSLRSCSEGGLRSFIFLHHLRLFYSQTCDVGFV